MSAYTIIGIYVPAMRMLRSLRYVVLYTYAAYARSVIIMHHACDDGLATEYKLRTPTMLAIIDYMLLYFFYLIHATI